MTTAPLVSVIIAAYNSARYIRQAVDSVFEQTYARHEVIVVDDGSTDDTRQLLEPYLNRIQYVYQDNQGPGAARNHGLRLARGEVVVFLDADDYLLPSKLTDQLACLAADPSLGAVHSGWRLVDRQGELLRDVQPWREAPRLDLETWVWWRPVCLGAMLFRRDWLESAGPFDTQLRQAEDIDLLLRLAMLRCGMVWLHRPTMCYRQHDRNTTRDGRALVKYDKMALDKFFKQPGIPWRIRHMEDRVRYYTMLRYAWRLYVSGSAEDAVSNMQRALACSPHPRPLTMFDWAGQFARHAARDGHQVDILWTLLPHIQAAVGLDHELCIQAERAVRWWVEVWWHCMDGDEERAAEGLASFRGLDPRQLVELAQNSVLVSPPPDTVAPITQFWGHARSQGLVPTSSRHDVAHLYLLVFAKALVARYWAVAWQAISAALSWSFHPRAVPAWFRFLRIMAPYLLVSARIE